MSHPIEAILRTSLKRLLMWGIPMTGAGLVLRAPPPADGLFSYTVAHLFVVQLATFLLTIELGRMTDEPWFDGASRPWLASLASLVAAVVGFSALLTLGTSAAVRYDPSLQFLQLLSSLDIAWVVAAIYLGARYLWSNTVGLVAGAILLAACVLSIAVYLSVVGFTRDGGWLVSGPDMLRIVISSDAMAAVFSLGTLFAADRRAQATLQASPQS